MRLAVIFLFWAAGVIGANLLEYGHRIAGAVLLGTWAVFFGALLVQRWRSSSLSPDATRRALLHTASPEPVGDFRSFGYRRRVVAPPLVLCVAAVAGCAWLVELVATDSTHAAVEEVAAAVFVFLGLVILRAIPAFGRAMMPGRAGLIVDDDGILEATRLGKSRYRRVAWSELAGAHWVAADKRLVLELADARAYVARQSRFARLGALLSLKLDANGVSINRAVLAASAAEIEEAFRRYSRGAVQVR